VGVDMRSETKRGIAVAGGTLGAVMVGYVAVLGLTSPTAAKPAPASPVAPADPGAVLPPKGQFERAVRLAEEHTGGVTIKAEAKNGKGVYEIDVALGNEEIEVVVDTSSGQVMELDREVEAPFDDD
jgi:hypothetical protein